MNNTTNTSVTLHINSIINVVSLFMDCVALLTCMIYLCIIIVRVIQLKVYRRRRYFNISLILSINIISDIFVKALLQTTHVSYPTFARDFLMVDKSADKTIYQMRAYMLWSINGVVYWSYTLVAFYRFVRVIYPTKVWLQRSFIYVYVLIPGEHLAVFSAMLVIPFVFESIRIFPGEVYCTVIPLPCYSIVYASFVMFNIPFNIVCIFYYLITRRLRQTTAVRREQDLYRRDFIVIRRMIVNMILLIIAIIPYGIVALKGYIEHNFYSLTERIEWLSSSLSSCLFAFTLPFITPKLREFLKQNRIMPANN
ncbi:unnamed protein product [Adineta ricciae]|uniref:G-protein coupled receptors family 1 profile domain-containing protein n=1 Tax=Adineta ricciae TaxID=249248 RepID=A0A814AKN7_ADIRI|nr:unnamed protein product [Adineta ricciae]CAF1153707.1 unnamed protein product [Adineta ricciae]